MFGVTTLAALTKTVPFSMVIVKFPPLSVCTLVPFERSVLYMGSEPLMTWYVKIDARASSLKFASADPMLWKASLIGAKMVRSGVESTASMRLVALRAPRRAVRFAADAVAETFSGSVRTRSMT
jgi:hypothetical protein